MKVTRVSFVGIPFWEYGNFCWLVDTPTFRRLHGKDPSPGDASRQQRDYYVSAVYRNLWPAEEVPHQVHLVLEETPTLRRVTLTTVRLPDQEVSLKGGS